MEPAVGVCSIIPVSGSSRNKIWRKGGFKKKKKRFFCAFILRFGGSMNSLHCVLLWLGWCIPEVGICQHDHLPNTQPQWISWGILWYLSAPASKCIPQPFPLVGQDTLKMAVTSLSGMTFPWNVWILAGNSGWSTGYPFPPRWFVFRLLQGKDRHMPLSSQVSKNSRGCKSSSPKNPLLWVAGSKLRSFTEHQAGKWVSWVLPCRHFHSSWKIYVSVLHSGTVNSLLSMRQRGGKLKHSFPLPQELTCLFPNNLMSSRLLYTYVGSSVGSETWVSFGHVSVSPGTECQLILWLSTVAYGS